MARTTMINFRIDEDVKKNMEEVCSKMGLTMTAALNIFINKVTMERRIPFEITADPDPFFSESNIRYLEKKMIDYKAGQLNLAEHELLEE
ncbi:MAG: type II toxin-antitoxin system RelB/DinJ family antitoxin [Blautia sp.]|nr:type II toxin-antitoxin system RelB/DinJ family antitoxin [Blautia sp.]MCM1200795.1 type II toxin-antitoxin system RelB/DinJ family antitoxin [Bacteroides fragilis]